MTELFAALKARDVERVKKLVAGDPALAAQAGPDGMRPLTFALYMRLSQAVDALLGAGARPTPHELAMMGRTAEVEAAIRADPALLMRASPDGWPMLHYAAHFGNIDTLLALVRLGAPLQQKGANPMENCAIHAAAAGGSVEAVRALIELGADPNARAAGGHVALHNAAAAGNVELADVLLRAGADVRAVNSEGKSAVDIARAHDEDEMAEWLRKQGAA